MRDRPGAAIWFVKKSAVTFENLIGAYMPFIGNELKLTVALAIIIVVVIFRPGGLFGKVVVSRV